jgi:hypothetical protein
MAYILGLWFTDGYIASNKNLFSITLHRHDKYLLQRILDEMKSKHPLHRTGNSYRFCITSKKLVKSIKRLGGVPRKSLICGFPKVPNKYLPDFIRGCWDGDGSIWFCKHDQRYHSGFASGSFSFISELTTVLERVVGHDIKIQKIISQGSRFIVDHMVTKEGILYRIHLGINDTCKLRDYMYRDMNDKLTMLRKQKRFFDSGNVVISNQNKQFLPYNRAILVARSLGIKTREEWKDAYRNKTLVPTLPSAPNWVYREKWESWGKWLGRTDS